MEKSLSVRLGTRERSRSAVSNSPPVLFGMMLALALLLLYTLTMSLMIYSVVCTANRTCTAGITITDGMVMVFTTIGGLVSAFVLTQLAITRPGDHPANNLVPADASKSFRRKAQAVGTLYLVVWMFAGLAALVVGVMVYPGISTTLADAGTTWIGLAVAAGYSYFGIKPPGARPPAH